MSVKAIPDGYHAVTPYLTIRDAAAALEFYPRALDATVCFRIAGPDGKVGHAEIRIGGSVIMLSDEFPEMDVVSPQTLSGATSSLLLYVENVDALFAKAVAAGCTVVKPIANQFYGDRSGTVKDPFGHRWTIATHVEDVTPEEMARRVAEFTEKA